MSACLAETDAQLIVVRINAVMSVVGFKIPSSMFVNQISSALYLRFADLKMQRVIGICAQVN